MMEETRTDYLNIQPESLLGLAEELGIADDCCFRMNYNLLLTQTNLLKKLKEEFEKDSNILITKEYANGHKKVIANPLIDEINKTISSSNRTTTLLYKLACKAKQSMVSGLQTTRGLNLEKYSIISSELAKSLSDKETFVNLQTYYTNPKICATTDIQTFRVRSGVKTYLATREDIVESVKEIKPGKTIVGYKIKYKDDNLTNYKEKK